VSTKEVNMPIIIHVVGASNSGKSSSIRLFLEDRGLVFPASPKDVTLVAPISKNGKTSIAGIGSAGDNQDVVDKNFNFFIGNNCDVIICASKSRGESYDRVLYYVHNLNAQHIILRTQCQNNVSAQRADNRRVADEIWQNIP